jgi:hypothetical protein
MPPIESGNNVRSSSEQANIAQERAKVCANSRQECLAHQSDMKKAHPETPFGTASLAPKKKSPTDAEELPSTALNTETIRYLTTKCAGDDRLFTLAKVQAQKLLQDDPTILGKEGEEIDDLGQMLLDDCVSEAEIAAKTETENQKLETIATEQAGLEKDNTTHDVLSKLNEVARDEFDKGGSIDQKLTAIATRMADVPNSEVALAKITQAQEMITALRSVVTDPLERNAFENILSSSFVDVGADTMSVAFAGVMSQVEDSDEFSPETRAAIAQKLGIVQLHDKVETGGDINDIFNKGYGVETYLDEDGTVKTRQIHLDKKERISIGRGQEIGLDETGGRAIWVQTQVGKFQASIPERATDHDMGNIIRTIQMRASLHGMNMAEVFYPDAEVFERGGGLIKIRTEDYTITEKLRSIIIGHEAIDGNKLFTTADLAKVPYLMQFHSRHGDYVTGDVDPTQMREDYRAQGIIDKDGQVDWVRFEELVMNNRAHTYTAPQNFKNTVSEAT